MIDPIVKQQFRDDLALARFRVVIAELQSNLVWLDKEWARHGVDFESNAMRETMDCAYRLFQIDAIDEQAREIDGRDEARRESDDDRFDEKVAKAQAPICHAYQAKYGGEFLDEATQTQRAREKAFADIIQQAEAA